MRVSVFGLGYVGAVSAACFAKRGHEVVGVDPDERKLELMRAGKAPVVEEGVDELIGEVIADGSLRVTSDAAEAVAATDVSLVCVGTPSAPDGSLGVQYVERVTEEIGAAIAAKDGRHTFVLRSTVVPGTTLGVVKPILERIVGPVGEKYGLAYNPEFLREGTSIKDFDAPPFTIVGASDERDAQAVEGIYAGVEAPVHRCDISTAEAIKYACNLFHATKITFANEIGMACQTVGVDSRKVMEIVCADTKLNVSAKYMRPGFAFGGSCLPKDLRAFTHMSRVRNAPLSMFEAMLRSNREQIDRVAQRIMSLGKRKITMLGISFKEGTDDLRESPLVSLAEVLIGKGYEVRIFDPNVEYASLFGSNKRFIDRELPHLKGALVSAEVGLKHGEVVVFGHNAEDYRRLLERVTPEQQVVDLTGGATSAGNHGVYEGLYW
ncbi:MAG: nucleotide sugar dehydrogenase [Planctomycetota bacterium]